MDNKKQDPLWQTAEKRVKFRYHAYAYAAINVFLWVIWLISNYRRSEFSPWEFPWPIYVMLGWGIGLFFHYLNSYGLSGRNAIEEEYKKLKKRNDRIPK